jgi:hypothetical protein
MQVEAFYDQGQLAFISPVKLRQGRIRLVIQIPDEAIIDEALANGKPGYQLPPEVLALALAMEERLERVRDTPLPDNENLPPLSEKKLARIEAFALRDEIRSLH